MSLTEAQAEAYRKLFRLKLLDELQRMEAEMEFHIINNRVQMEKDQELLDLISAEIDRRRLQPRGGV